MTNDPQWSPCQHGTIQDLTSEKTSMTRRVFVNGAMTAVTGGLCWMAAQKLYFNPLDCHQTMTLANDYVAGRLPQRQRDQVDAHRRGCEDCDHHLTLLERLARQV